MVSRALIHQISVEVAEARRAVAVALEAAMPINSLSDERARLPEEEFRCRQRGDVVGAEVCRKKHFELNDRITGLVGKYVTPAHEAVRSVIEAVIRLLDLLPTGPPELQAISSRIEQHPVMRVRGDRGSTTLLQTSHDLEALQLRLDEIAAKIPPEKSNRGPRPLAFPEGTVWEQVSIQVLGDRQIQVVRPIVFEALRYAEAGFMDARSGNPVKSWELLEILAEGGGRATYDFKRHKELAALVKDFNKRLRELMRIPGNPVTPRRERGSAGYYAARFRIGHTGRP